VFFALQLLASALISLGFGLSAPLLIGALLGLHRAFLLADLMLLGTLSLCSLSFGLAFLSDLSLAFLRALFVVPAERARTSACPWHVMIDSKPLFHLVV